MNISPELLGELVAHVLGDPGNEVCGVIAVDPESAGSDAADAVLVLRATNIHRSPLKFEIDPDELLALWKEIEGDALELGGIYHSHVRSAPYPSQTDINFAANWPGVEWIIVGLAPGAEPEVRSYAIDAGVVREVTVGGAVS
jgi:proteasome lid subunit RPN8/RPN11